MKIFKAFLVLHYSNDYVFNPVMRQCETIEQAKKYIEDFRSASPYHKDDEYAIVQVMEQGTIKPHHGHYRFKV
jgi:hypothetical protein